MTSLTIYNNNKQTTNTKTLWSKPNENKRKTLWNDIDSKTFTPLPYDSFPISFTINSFEILIRRTRLLDINKRLLNEDWEEEENKLIRSPSPEPEYDKKTNIRLNTFSNRMKKKYLIEKNNIIEELILIDPSFKPPTDYIPNEKQVRLKFNNTKQYNISSLLIGPEGRTLKELQKKLKCRLRIDNEEEAIYIYSSKSNELEIAKEYILPLLDPFSKEHIHFKNEKKKEFEMQLGIKSINQIGNNGVGCENCGDRGHSTWACIVNNDDIIIKCEVCGDKGHITFDCKLKNKEENVNNKEEDDKPNEYKDININNDNTYDTSNKELKEKEIDDDKVKEDYIEVIKIEEDNIVKEEESNKSNQSNSQHNNSNQHNNHHYMNMNMHINPNQLYSNNIRYMQNINNINHMNHHIQYPLYPQVLNPLLLRQPFPQPQIPMYTPVSPIVPIQSYHPQMQTISNYYPTYPQQVMSNIIPPINQNMNMNMLLQQQKLMNPYLYQKIMKNNQKPYLKKK